jgi:hypothetical protein
MQFLTTWSRIVLALTSLSASLVAQSPVGSNFCAGDGSALACPCGNFSAVGADVGCLNSFAIGGSLRATSSSGTANVAADIAQTDIVTLTGTQMPASSTCIYFQGSRVQPIVFGDGLRCVNNPFLVQLGAKTNVAGASQFPDATDLSLNRTCGGQSWVMSPIPIGTVLAYQVWYRNIAAFCTPATFNLTNAVAMVWI